MTARCWLQTRKPDGGTSLGAPPPGPRASGSSTTPSTSTGTPQTTGKRSSRPTITPSDFHINHEGSRNGYTTPRDLTYPHRSAAEPAVLSRPCHGGTHPRLRAPLPRLAGARGCEEIREHT